MSGKVIGDDTAVALAGSQRNFELYEQRISTFVNESVMLVTALGPVIGYDKASAIARNAQSCRASSGG